jgi:hypothetical protein
MPEDPSVPHISAAGTVVHISFESCIEEDITTDLVSQPLIDGVFTHGNELCSYEVVFCRSKI